MLAVLVEVTQRKLNMKVVFCIVKDEWNNETAIPESLIAKVESKAGRY
jgi:hypothetical protein